MKTIESIHASLLAGENLPDELIGCKIYPRSIHTSGGALYFMARSQEIRFLVAAGRDALPPFDGTSFMIDTLPAKKCALSPGNAAALMAAFPFTKPSSHKNAPFTIGLGDRLGLASPGHIRTVLGRGTFPVLAQQSIRELTLTGRSYEEVLAAAVFAVFQEDWREGWGADGDHLKTAEEVRYALGCGYTMITLDCSEQIDRGVAELGADALRARYDCLPQEIRTRYETKYASKRISLDGVEISIGGDALKSIVLTYHKAIDYTIELYHSVISTCGRDIDFEMSIDETSCSTEPAAHFVVARELTAGGVQVASLAPRFCGEFQKGIDYIGDTTRFESEFKAHQAIAAHFGYKLSIHSGSDKFAVFSIIGRHTGLRVHVKTAGTNWLEALRVVAREDPALFREILEFDLEHLDEARAYYHIGADPANIRPPHTLSDDRLGDYLEQPDTRQVLHITYGLVLQAKDSGGAPRFKDRIYTLLHRCEDEYAAALQKHIGRHIDTLRG